MESQNKLFEAFKEAAAADEQTTFLAQDKLWGKIEQQLDKQENKKIKLFSFTTIKYAAAALLLIAGIAVGWNQFFGVKSNENEVVVQKSIPVAAPVSPATEQLAVQNKQPEAGPAVQQTTRVIKPVPFVAEVVTGNGLVAAGTDGVVAGNAREAAPTTFENPGKEPKASNESLLTGEGALQHPDPQYIVQDLSLKAVDPATDLPAARLLKLQGIIVDKAGVALGNAKVSVPGTGRAVISDARGTFALEVPDTAQFIMVQSYGNETKYVKVADRHNYKIEISPDQSNVALLNDIARYNRSNGMQNFNSTPINTNSIRQELASRQKQQTMFRQAPTTEPLIIINGAPYAGKFSDINSKHIKEVKILAEAEARVLYGERAKNGVIVITLKKGKTAPGQ